MKNRKGFTLIELVIVILILGILISATIPLYGKNADKAIIAEAQTALGVLKTQLELYKSNYGEYPSNAVTFAKSEYYNASDMQCTYVDDSCMDYKKVGKDSYKLICTSKYAGKSSNVAGTYYKADKIDQFKDLNVTITLDKSGDFTIEYNK